MIDRFKKFPLPRTVDEAVDVLISDLTTQQMDAMSHMSDEAFEALCRQVAPYLDHDFHLWSGNDQLLMHCLDSVPDATGADPTRIIMDQMRERLSTELGIYFAV